MKYTLKYVIPFHLMKLTPNDIDYRLGSNKEHSLEFTKDMERERIWRVYYDKDLAVKDTLYLQDQGCICRMEITKDEITEECEGI